MSDLLTAPPVCPPHLSVQVLALCGGVGVRVVILPEVAGQRAQVKLRVHLTIRHWGLEHLKSWRWILKQSHRYDTRCRTLTQVHLKIRIWAWYTRSC